MGIQNIERDKPQEEVRRPYVQPTLRVMDESEILAAFQMTAARISAAGCWWGSCSC
jgi:hypothetical protein